MQLLERMVLVSVVQMLFMLYKGPLGVFGT